MAIVHHTGMVTARELLEKRTSSESDHSSTSNRCVKSPKNMRTPLPRRLQHMPNKFGGFPFPLSGLILATVGVSACGDGGTGAGTFSGAI